MKKIAFYIMTLIIFSSCDDFLNKYPLSEPTSETFWTSADNAELWVNNLYNALPNAESAYWDNWSDNAFCRTKPNEMGGEIANGTYQTNSGIVFGKWNYSTVRRCFEFFDKIETIPNIKPEIKATLEGQVYFILAYTYFDMITLFRDIPLIQKVTSIDESDIPKSPKSEVLAYVLQVIDKAIDCLPAQYPASETGRATKGAALALKAKILLFNERWAEAAATAKELMDMNQYELHPQFDELFLKSFNNKTKEVILASQYAELVKEHDVYRKFGIMVNADYSLVLPLPDLANSFECTDGLPIAESPLYDPAEPDKNRDPRFYSTFIYPYETYAGTTYDPLNSTNKAFSLTYLHYRKYVNDKTGTEGTSFVNWILIRYAEVLLMYAEAKNEANGPDGTIYDALDLIRVRAGMPKIDRNKYNTKESLREIIRNERRIELAAEGFRYFDIIRWRIAEDVLNKEIFSFEIPDVLPIQNIEKRIFDPKKHYVWPIPQNAIDRAKNLEQHSEWK